MDRSTAVVYGTVTLVLAVTVLSGPAVGVVDLTTPRIDAAGLGEGSATVDEVDAPAAAALDRGYRSESYYLKVPNARIHVAEITGRPLAAYRLEIPAMNYSRSTTHFLGPNDAGWVELSLAQDTFPADRIERDAYEGRLSIVVRASGNETVVHDEPITVEVTG